MVEIVENEIYDGSNKYLNHLCKICNRTWATKPNYILHMDCGCVHCSSSKGEKEISLILDKLLFVYEKEKMVKINGINYRFDFYIPEISLFIEYDGIQHFEPIEFFGGDDQFELIKNNDIIKNKWITDNNYHIIRIPFYINDIQSFIFEYFNR